LLDPQVVLDYEEDKQFSIIDAEFGMMLDKYLGTKGHSVYVPLLLELERNDPRTHPLKPDTKLFGEYQLGFPGAILSFG